MLDSTEFLKRLEESEFTPSDLFTFFAEKKMIDKKRFPYLFDGAGRLILETDGKNKYHTFCPYHDGHDSFHINNVKKTCYCFNGSCPASVKPLNLIDLVMSFHLELDLPIIYDFELAKPYFWKAVHFLVANFGDSINVKMEEITSDKTFTRVPTEEILKETSNYYHFLATKTVYKEKVVEYLSETRHFKYSKIPVEELMETYQIGITPFSKTQDKLYEYLLKKNFTKEEILDSKVCFLNDKNEIKDSLYGRIVIPYIYKGKVIGLYGRDNNPNGVKKFRHKRLEGEVRIPNGLDKIFNDEEFYMVEGEFSKIAIASLGFPNVLEARGVNGFRVEHADLIKRIRQNDPSKCKRVYIIFDPDDAGADSIKKIGQRLVDAGVEVLVIRLPVTFENEKSFFIDPNDLLDIYKENAHDEFVSLKNKAISLDAFVLLHESKKNPPATISQARMLFKHLAVNFESIEPLERVFILEEFLTHFESALPKDILRPYLVDLWVNIEQKKPIEGFERAIISKQPFFLITKKEELFSEHNKALDFIVLVRDFEKLAQLNIKKSLLLDDSFSTKEIDILKKTFKQLQIKPAKITFKEDHTFEMDFC